MSDLHLIWNIASADLAVAHADFEIDDGLETAVILSLMCDRRADPFDVLPTSDTDPRGWWGDVLAQPTGDRIGSKLWLLSREKQELSVLGRAESYAAESLEWLIEDKVAATVDVVASFPRREWLGIEVTITRPGGTTRSYRYDYTWTAEGLRVQGSRTLAAVLPVDEDGAVMAKFSTDLQAAATTGDGSAFDTNTDSVDVVFFIIGNGAVSAGAVTLEESHDQTYTGAWSPFGAPIDVLPAGVKVARYRGCIKAIRARITTPIAGGSVTVKAMGV